jgi:hypothetical protein
LQKKIVKGAKETLARFNTELQSSSEHSLALKQNDFQLPPMFAESKRAYIQMQELSGKAA